MPTRIWSKIFLKTDWKINKNSGSAPALIELMRSCSGREDANDLQMSFFDLVPAPKRHRGASLPPGKTQTKWNSNQATYQSKKYLQKSDMHTFGVFHIIFPEVEIATLAAGQNSSMCRTKPEIKSFVNSESSAKLHKWKWPHAKALLWIEQTLAWPFVFFCCFFDRAQIWFVIETPIRLAPTRWLKLIDFGSKIIHQSNTPW